MRGCNGDVIEVANCAPRDVSRRASGGSVCAYRRTIGGSIGAYGRTNDGNVGELLQGSVGAYGRTNGGNVGELLQGSVGSYGRTNGGNVDELLQGSVGANWRTNDDNQDLLLLSSKSQNLLQICKKRLNDQSINWISSLRDGKGETRNSSKTSELLNDHSIVSSALSTQLRLSCVKSTSLDTRRQIHSQTLISQEKRP